MQGKVWRHIGGMLLSCNLCVFAELLCRLQPVLFPGGASLQLHVGWKSSEDPQFAPSSWWETTLQVCVCEHTQWPLRHFVMQMLHTFIVGLFPLHVHNVENINSKPVSSIITFIIFLYLMQMETCCLYKEKKALPLKLHI